MQNQELRNYLPVTWAPSPRLQPVKYKKIKVEMPPRTHSAFADSLDAAADALEREARRLRRSADEARTRDKNERELRQRLDSARDIARAEGLGARLIGLGENTG